jgi:hypothetical protein
MKMASNSYSNSSSAGNFPIDWDSWRTTSGTVYNPWIITTTGTIGSPVTITSPGWLDSEGRPNPLDALSNPIPDSNRLGDILDSLRVPEEWMRQIEQTRTQTEIQQRMALLEAEMRRAGTGLPVLKKVVPRKPLRMIRLREDAKKS